MLQLMKAVLFDKPWSMRVVDLPQPQPRAGEVLLAVEAVGICGSDVHGFTGESGRRAPDMVMGHEVGARVAALGPGAGGPPVGTPVAVYNVIAEHAPSPAEGDPSFLNKQVIGVNLARRGAMAEYVAVPAANAIPTAPQVGSDIAALAEPAAVAGHAFDRLAAHGRAPGRLAILGAGTIGLCAAAAGRRRGFAPIVVLDTVAAKAASAAGFDAVPYHLPSGEAPAATSGAVEAALGGRPAAVVDAVGTAPSFALAFQLCRPDAALLAIGNLAKEVSLPLQDLVSDEVSVIGSYGFDRASFQASVDALPELAGGLATFIEGRCTLDDVPAVMTALARGERQERKVIIDVAGAAEG